MKKLLLLGVALSALGGCVSYYPAHYGYYHHYHHDRRHYGWR